MYTRAELATAACTLRQTRGYLPSRNRPAFVAGTYLY